MCFGLSKREEEGAAAAVVERVVAGCERIDEAISFVVAICRGWISIYRNINVWI